MQILSKYDLFIFDWDHTLTTSTLVVSIMQIINKVRKEKRASRHKEKYELNDEIKKIRIREDFSKLYSLFDDLYSVFFKPRLKKDTINLLRLLKKNHKKVAIFSDSKTYRLMKETRELGVLDYVDYALCAESINKYKPDPTGLLLLLDKLKVSKKRSVYMGDMTSDVLTAKFAGIDSCAISDGIDTYKMLREAKPTYAFERLSDFFIAIKK